jgi:hypothetical protein
MPRLAAKADTLKDEEKRVMPDEGENQTDDPLVSKLADEIKAKLGISADFNTLAQFLQAVLSKLTGETVSAADTAIASSVRETLGLGADASAAEVTLALKVRGDGNVEFAALREAEAERQAAELVDTYVRRSVLDGNDMVAMTAARSLAREHPDRLRAMLDKAIPPPPQGRATPPTGRQTLIAKAPSEWQDDDSM